MSRFIDLVKTVTRHVKRFLKKSYKDNISALAGQSAFFIILSAPPLMMFAFTVFSLLTGTSPESFTLPYVNIPETSGIYPYYRLILRFIESSIRRSGSGTAVITAVVTLWSAGKGLYCITEGISRIYRLPNKSIWLFKRVYAMGYTVVMLLMMLVCMAALMMDVVFIGGVGTLFGDYKAKWPAIILLFTLFGILQASVMTLALKLFLRRKLKRKQYYSFRAMFPGMFLTVAAWYGLTVGVVIYIRHFATTSIYGSLVSVFIAMLWIYFVMYILLYGIQFNYIYRRWLGRKRTHSAAQRAVVTNMIEEKESNHE